MKRVLPLAAVVAVSLIALVALALFGSGRHGIDASPMLPEPRAAQPAAGNRLAAGLQGAPQPSSFVGVVVARDSVEVAARTDGWVTDVKVGPDGNVYVSTHGRGIWKIAPVAG